MNAVIDTGVVMNTNYLPEIKGRIYIPTRVVEEIRSNIARNIFDLLKGRNKITVIDPNNTSREIIRGVANKIGQTDLSETDIDVLALAVMLQDEGVILYSDDYGIRNIAHALELESKGVSTTGGKQKRHYNFICKACGKKYQQKPSDCDVCGKTRFIRIRIP